MQSPAFRTSQTWLSENQLILLDVLFDGAATFNLLRRKIFEEQWNLGYSHDMNDDELSRQLHQMCEQGVLEEKEYQNKAFFQMTPVGGLLWSQERQPIWERYCTERYRMTSRQRTIMSVTAVSPQVRDHFLALWPPESARRRTTVIGGQKLIDWHPFTQKYVGVAIYDDPEVLDWTRIERERSWWRSVPELQRFLPGHS